MDGDARLRELWDHHLIRQLLSTYCTGCDRADEPRMAGTYAAESWDDHGPDNGPGGPFAAKMTARVALNETCSHQLGQSQIVVRGDEAAAETYFIATVRKRDGEGRDTLHQLGGRYVDMLVRVGEDWRIADRICVRDWSTSTLIAADWLRDAGFVAGRTDGTDPAYARLGLSHGGHG
jgi:hypothetical protein